MDKYLITSKRDYDIYTRKFAKVCRWAGGPELNDGYCIIQEILPVVLSAYEASRFDDKTYVIRYTRQVDQYPNARKPKQQITYTQNPKKDNVCVE